MILESVYEKLDMDLDVAQCRRTPSLGPLANGDWQRRIEV